MKRSILLIAVILLTSTMLFSAPIKIRISGGKLNPDNSITYRIVNIDTNGHGAVTYKECRGRGVNSCPAVGIVTVGSMDINVEKQIYPIIIENIEKGNKCGKTMISGIKVVWENAIIVGENNLECDIDIGE